MHQTFDDVCRSDDKRLLGSTQWMFLDTAIGAGRERALQLMGTGIMTETIIEPRRAALITGIFCLPFAAAVLIPLFGVEPLLGMFKTVATIDGQQVSPLGRFMILGALLLLPVAFLVNLSSMLARPTKKRKISFHPRLVNLALGGVVLSTIVFIASWMVVESVDCSRGICD